MASCFGLLHAMFTLRVQPDSFGFNTVINSLRYPAAAADFSRDAALRSWQVALALLEAMPHLHTTPDARTLDMCQLQVEIAFWILLEAGR